MAAAMTRKMGAERMSIKEERITSSGRFNSGSFIKPIGIDGDPRVTPWKLTDKLLDPAMNG
jgi:hypothetical protein